MSTHEALDRDQLEAWVSLIRVSQLLPARLDHALHAEQTSLPRYEILAVLARQPDGIRLTDLCERALVSKPRVTLHVSELVAAGFVERRPDPTDGRASIVTITPPGRDMLERWQPGHRALARQLVVDVVDADELRSLAAVLAKIRVALGDEVDISGAHGG